MKNLGILALSLAFLGALPAQARFGRGFHGPGQWQKSPMIMKQVLKDAGLSDGQIRSIQSMHGELEKKQLDLRHELEKERLALKQMLNTYQVDENAVLVQVEKLGALKLKLKKLHIQFRLNVRKEMTPEQWEKVRSLRAEKRMEFRKEFRTKRKKRMLLDSY